MSKTLCLKNNIKDIISTMEDINILRNRIRELSYKAFNGCLTHTSFLSLSEQSYFYSILNEEHIPIDKRKYNEVSFLLYGGHIEDDRKILFFLPSYIDESEFVKEIDDGELISCLYIKPKNIKFSDKLTHRDFLGSLMHLGFKREMFGDILTDGSRGYVFTFTRIANLVKDNLLKIKHTFIETEVVKPSECKFIPQFIERRETITSLRLDCVISKVFNLSRRESQELISKENVFINGMSVMNNSYQMKNDDRVSIKGYGKFIFLAKIGTSKKNKEVIKVKIYV